MPDAQTPYGHVRPLHGRGSYDLGASYVVGDFGRPTSCWRNPGRRASWWRLAAEGRRDAAEAGAEEACVLITDSWAEIVEYIRRGERRVVVTRKTRKTRITGRLDLDGRGFSTCGTAENEMAEKRNDGERDGRQTGKYGWQ